MGRQMHILGRSRVVQYFVICGLVVLLDFGTVSAHGYGMNMQADGWSNRPSWGQGLMAHFLSGNRYAGTATTAGPSFSAYASSGSVSGGDWPSFIFNWKNSRYQANSAITSANVGQLKSDWFFHTFNSVTDTPIVSGGAVIFGDWGGFAYSVNAITGNLIWRTYLGNTISSSPAASNGIVYFGVGPNSAEVYALSQRTGNVMWTTTLGSTARGIWASPIIFGGQVFIGTAGSIAQGSEDNASWKGKIYALNAMTGNKDWIKTIAGTAGGAGVWSSVAFDPSTGDIFFGTGNPYSNNGTIKWAYSIVALKASNGSLVWTYQIYNSLASGGDLDFGSTPNLFSVSVNGIAHKAVGLGAKDGKYYIVDRGTGKLLETFQMPQVGNGTVGIIGVAGYMFTTNSFLHPEIFVPSYTNGVPDFTNSAVCCGNLEAILPGNGPSGTVAWNFKTPSNLVGSVAEVPGAVLAGDIAGNLYAISASNGTQLFYTKLNASVFGGISAAENRIYVPTAFSSYSNSLGVHAFST